VTQKKQIKKAILAGAQTSTEIASAIGACRANISVALHRLADFGLIERAGVVNVDQIGRPHVRWRLRAPIAASNLSSRSGAHNASKLASVE
jgi:predicted transcriptional regulator